MRPSQITGIATAAFFSVTISAFAQTPTTQTPTPQTPTTQTPAPQEKTAAPQTFTGCLMSEPDYRRAHNLGEGTVGGAGLGDEFVLVDVKVSPAKEPSATAAASDPAVEQALAKIGTAEASKCADQGTAYRLTGPNEDKLKGLAGRQLEIQGRFKDPTDPRTGEKMPNEVEILSFREAPAAAAIAQPATPPTPAQTTPPPPPPTQTAPPTPAQTTPPPPPPVQTAPPATPPAQPAPAMATRTELPRTASSTALLGLVGVLALSSGIALTHRRRRE